MLTIRGATTQIRDSTAQTAQILTQILTKIEQLAEQVAQLNDNLAGLAAGIYTRQDGQSDLLSAISSDINTLRFVTENSRLQLLGILENTGIAAQAVDENLPIIRDRLADLLDMQRACCIARPPDVPLLPPELPDDTSDSSLLCKRMHAVARLLRDVFQRLVFVVGSTGLLGAPVLLSYLATVAPELLAAMSGISAQAVSEVISRFLRTTAPSALVPDDDQLRQAVNDAYAQSGSGLYASNSAFRDSLSSSMGIVSGAFNAFFLALGGFARAFDETVEIDVSGIDEDCGQGQESDAFEESQLQVDYGGITRVYYSWPNRYGVIGISGLFSPFSRPMTPFGVLSPLFRVINNSSLDVTVYIYRDSDGASAVISLSPGASANFNGSGFDGVFIFSIGNTFADAGSIILRNA